jgi:NhaP-type Na+/H+ or K+/H+ antiporter
MHFRTVYEMYDVLTIFAGFIFVYSVFAGWLARTPISGAIVFCFFGWLIGPLALNLFDEDVGAPGLRLLAELTLALVLFADASKIDLAVLRRGIVLPRRLLLIGLPLIILLGFGAGVALFESLTLLEIALLATVLAPTDAALGSAVISDARIPVHIRQGLSMESGLNDGICVPILLLFLALATQSHHDASGVELAFLLVAEEIGIGAAVGLGLTLVGTQILKQCAQRGWVTETWRQLPVISLAIGNFAAAQLIGGSGFIAAFVGGLLFGALAKDRKHVLLLAAEGTGETLALVTWVVFGAVIIGHTIDELAWQAVAYALLSLTVVRMLPVFLVLAGTGLRTAEKLFIGWFGPRGMASIVFGVIVIQAEPAGSSILRQTIISTILLSILAHGLSANPLVAALAARVKGGGENTG